MAAEMAAGSSAALAASSAGPRLTAAAAAATATAAANSAGSEDFSAVRACAGYAAAGLADRARLDLPFGFFSTGAGASAGSRPRDFARRAAASFVRNSAVFAK